MYKRRFSQVKICFYPKCSLRTPRFWLDSAIRWVGYPVPSLRLPIICYTGKRDHTKEGTIVRYSERKENGSIHIYGKEFDFVIQRALSLKRPARMVVAGADCENILKAVCKAEKQGFCRPILVGNGDKIRAMLEKLGLADRNYTISHVSDYEFNTDYSDCHVYMRRAIGIINDGLGDVLVRGNTSSRSFLMPILDKKNGLVTGLVSEVALVNPLLRQGSRTVRYLRSDQSLGRAAQENCQEPGGCAESFGDRASKAVSTRFLHSQQRAGHWPWPIPPDGSGRT